MSKQGGSSHQDGEDPYVDVPINKAPKASKSTEKLKAVIVALDTSVHSERAFHYYVEHFYRPDHRVVLVHSSEHPKVAFGEGSGKDYDEEITRKEADLRTVEDFFVSLLEKKKIQYKSRFVWHDGKPGEAIVHMANEEKAILIVTGSRGLGKIRRTILGSTSDYVMHHTNIPVMICPKKHEDVS